MPYSYHTFNSFIAFFIMNNFNKSKILDVGPGAGKYSILLKDVYSEIDGVEIFEPNIEKFDLHKKYSNIYNEDITKFNFEKGRYDLVVMGDILEHLSVEDAHKTLEYLSAQDTPVLVVVPYEYEQGSVDGNDHEEHLQDDLTHEIMQKRYPNLICLIKDAEIGVYFTDYRVK